MRGGCPACGGALSPWRVASSADPAIGGTYQLLRCASCATAVTEGNQPIGLLDRGAFAASPRLAAAAEPLLRAFDRRRLAILSELAPPPARVLDIGAGRGRFVATARAAGYEAEGLEPAARAADAARYGVRLRSEGIEDAEIDPGSLDAVVLWHVLEHLDDPAGALRRIARWLRPGGALLLGIPNLASLQARIGGARWYHLDVPRHRLHATPAGAEALLRATGLEPVRTHHVLAEHNPFGMWQTLVNRATATPSYLYNLLKRNAPLSPRDLAITLLALPLLPVAATIELIAGLARHGGTIAVLARKR